MIIGLLKKPHIGYAEYKIPPADKPLDYVSDEQLRPYHLDTYRLPLDNGGPSTMAACIIPSARAKCRRGADYDQVLKYPHPKTMKMTILWRINYAFDAKAKCSRCLEPFNRGHLNKCKVLAAHMNHKQSRINKTYAETTPVKQTSFAQAPLQLKFALKRKVPLQQKVCVSHLMQPHK